MSYLHRPEECHKRPCTRTNTLFFSRERLREQNALSDEINEAMINVSVSNVDETELEDELEQLQQEQLDEAMLKTGTVPVSDAVHRLPAAAEGPRKFAMATPSRDPFVWLTVTSVKGKAQAVEEEDEEAELRKLQAEMAM